MSQRACTAVTKLSIATGAHDSTSKPMALRDAAFLRTCVWVCHDEFRRCRAPGSADSGTVVVSGVAGATTASEGCAGGILGHCLDGGFGVAAVPSLKAVDGLAGADRDAVLAWSAALVVTGAVLAWLGIWRHRTMTQVRMDAAYRTVSAVTAQAVRLGATLDRRSRTGEVVAIGIGDVWTIGRSLTVTGPGVGAALAYVVIAVLLFQVSAPLAVVVLGGVLVLVLILGPALGWLQTHGAVYRSTAGRLDGPDR